MAASESCSQWLLTAMETLWFEKTVLSPEAISSSSKSSLVEIMRPSLSSLSASSESHPSSNSSFDYLGDDIHEQFSYGGVHGSLPTISTIQQIDSEDEDDKRERFKQEEGEVNIKESTPTMRNLVKKRMVKPTSTPIRRHIKTKLRLKRTLSCKTLAELEQQEVKGFMDLGFSFDKDRLTPRMMSVVPGLQRLQGLEEDDEGDENDHAKDGIKMVGGEAKRKPYLSEAWSIKRPDSPLVRLRMPMASTTSIDMKNHLKLWAKTVAYTATQHL